MDAQNLKLIESLAYAFYGICVLVGTLIVAMIKIVFDFKKNKTIESQKDIDAAVEFEKYKSENALKFQIVSGHIEDLQKRHNERDLTKSMQNLTNLKKQFQDYRNENILNNYRAINYQRLRRMPGTKRYIRSRYDN